MRSTAPARRGIAGGRGLAAVAVVSIEDDGRNELVAVDCLDDGFHLPNIFNSDPGVFRPFPMREKTARAACVKKAQRTENGELATNRKS